TYECSHRHGEGDRCLSFQFDDALFGRVAHDAGKSRLSFASDRLPPLKSLAAVTARACTAETMDDSFEEIALELAGRTIASANGTASNAGSITAADENRVARVLRRLEAGFVERHTIAELAAIAGLSRFHFLRTFRSVTGVTPHQWLLRARLRLAAGSLVGSRQPVSEIALTAGFDDLSNFIRSFRSEFGVSPRVYRSTG